MKSRALLFLAGAILGFLGALVVCWQFRYDHGWVTLGLPTLALGLMSAALGGKFWENILNFWP
jgi:hypothetical protein